MADEHPFWKWTGRISDTFGVIPPIASGIAMIGAVLSQHIPFVSAFGYAGIFWCWLTYALILSIISRLQVKQAKKGKKLKPKGGIAPSENKFVRFLNWKWLRAIFFIVCLAASLQFVDSRPPLPAGVKPEWVTLPIASYREMKQSKIVGRTVFLNAVPRSEKSPVLIENKAFEHCAIWGPAVVGNGSPNNLFHLCTFDVAEPTKESILMETKSPVSVGVISLADCKFEFCTFSLISFCGTHEMIEQLRSMPDYYGNKLNK